MATFDFYHLAPVIKFPDDQARVKFGRRFTFVTDPIDAPERTFTLMMTGITWTTDALGQAVVGPDLKLCAKTLYDFYVTHRMHRSFDYDLPGFGVIKARFNRPVEFPSAIPGGFGVLPEFEIELIEARV